MIKYRWSFLTLLYVVGECVFKYFLGTHIRCGNPSRASPVLFLLTF